MKTLLAWTQPILLASSLLLLGYCGFAAEESWIFQQREGRSLNRLLEIPPLGLSVVVIEGDDAGTLRRAVGLATVQGEYRYRVVSKQVVALDSVAVLSASGGEMLTLVTCYPFYFVGAAPDKLIVRAERLTSKPSGPGGLNL